MCGRYMFFSKTRHIQKIIEILKAKNLTTYHTGEIFPTNTVPVLVLEDQQINVTLMTWGFKNKYNSSVIINARSESVFDKPLFYKAIHTKRCVIPANGFYEWSDHITGKKEKYYFTASSQPTMYMAGIYQIVDNVKYFVILTKQANASMSAFHHRMPVLLTTAQVHEWLAPNAVANTIVKEASMTLSNTVT